MVAPTSFAARVATFLLSVSAHGAVALVTVGAHGAKEASSGAPLADRTIEIAAPEPIAADLPQSSTTPATTPEPFAKFPSHKHPYPVAVNHDAIPHDPSLRHPPITVAAAEPVTADAPDPASPPALAASAIEAPRFVLTVGTAWAVERSRGPGRTKRWPRRPSIAPPRSFRARLPHIRARRRLPAS